MEIQGNKHRHDGYKGLHLISQNHKTDLHTNIDEDTPMVSEKEDKASDTLPTHEEKKKYTVTKEVGCKNFSFSSVRFVDSEINLPDNVEKIWFKVSSSVTNNGIPSADWKMVFADELRNLRTPGIVRGHQLFNNSLCLNFGRSNEASLYISLSENNSFLFTGDNYSTVAVTFKFE